jgi:signal transduction histidine kinase
MSQYRPTDSKDAGQEMNSLLPSVQELKEMLHLASSRATWIFFAVPILLLLGIGIAADRTTASFAQSEYWVSHTQEVKAVIQGLRADVFMAQDSRKGYLMTGDDANLSGYRAALDMIPSLTQELTRLTADNPRQGARIARLQPIIERKMSVLQRSIDLKRNGDTNAAKQLELTKDNEDLTDQMSAVLADMAGEENALLGQRLIVSLETYRRMRMVLGVALVAVVLFLFMNFGRLLVELLNRSRAEAAVRRLSGRILQLQDLERRRIARELHDGVAQYFASSKMTVDGVLLGEDLSAEQREALTEASRLLEQGVAEARTLSHLLHPPLLDDIGFRAAAEWYINGFSERSKIKVQFTAAADLGAMPKEVELVLFRVLQESLTNIHRHAGSPTAEVRIFSLADRVTMEVKDQGKGIPEPLLDDFRKSTGTGVGLAGMRERVSEFQGKLDIASPKNQGTQLKVEIPLSPTHFAEAESSGPPSLQTSFRTNRERARSTDKGMLLATVTP